MQPLNPEAGAGQTPPPPVAGAQPVPPFPFDERTRIRGIQERLNAAGCEAGTADGVMGRKTRRGYGAFLKERGLSEDAHPIDSEAFWRALHSAPGGVICETMPVVPLTPQIMAGQWTYRSRCGASSKAPGLDFTGVLSLSHTGGGNFKGSLANSLGQRARITGRLSGRKVGINANFGFLLGRVQAWGTVADDAYVFYGRDSNGCRITARKR